MLSAVNLKPVHGLAAIAKERGESMSQKPISSVLRQPTVTSALIGSSSDEELDQHLDALNTPTFSGDELSRIDKYADQSGIDLWRRPATD